MHFLHAWFLKQKSINDLKFLTNATAIYRLLSLQLQQQQQQQSLLLFSYLTLYFPGPRIASASLTGLVYQNLITELMFDAKLLTMVSSLAILRVQC